MKALAVSLIAGCALTLAFACDAPPGADDDDDGEGEGEGEGEGGVGLCLENCVDDGDCTLGGGTLDLGLLCVDSFCTQPPCVSDLACTASESFWDTPCASNDECLADTGSSLCVDVDGAGECAGEAEAGACGFGLPLDVVDVDGAPRVACGLPQVCVEADGGDPRCEDVPCTEDNQCTIGESEICRDDGECVQCLENTDCAAPEPVCRGGFCGCGADADCAGSDRGEHCGANGLCGCSDDAECAGALFGDRCFDGSCGCADAADCSRDNVFDGDLEPICAGT